jgi:hypothetical protein
MRTVLWCSLLFSILGGASTAFAVAGIFDLQVSATGFSKAQRDAFAIAEELWESMVVSYATTAETGAERLIWLPSSLQEFAFRG